MVTNLRGLIPGLRNKIYLNYGGQGPLPDPSLNEIIKSWKIIQNIGPFTNEIWPFISNEIIQTKLVLSKFLGVARKNIALSENISTGMILPLWGIRFKTGDEILISDCEHPGIVAACRELCRRNNLKLKILSIQKIKNLNDQEFLSETLRHINQKTNLFIISHVLWNYGYQIPLKKLRYELNKLSYEPYLIVDGAQSFGHIEIQDEVKHVDLYSITSHKWACGPEGLGAIYLSDRFIENSRPTIIGWKSLKKEQGIYEPYENLFHEDARKFEIATSCTPLLAGLRKSLDLLDKNNSGIAKNKQITNLSNKLWKDLSQINNVKMILEHPLNNGIVSFNIDGETKKDEIIKSLGKKNIWIRIVEDPKWFRACIHQMTTENEINLLVNEIRLITT
tara:strand:+ start:875 stop:2050 length:1176 start_codon:yes stop_codon:yes gene_type:complete